jgi:hypothetical protein
MNVVSEMCIYYLAQQSSRPIKMKIDRRKKKDEGLQALRVDQLGDQLGEESRTPNPNCWLCIPCYK